MTPRALLVWGVGLLAYVTVVAARTSLSATGVTAAERFGATAAVLSLFAVLQLAVYAAMQIPAGALLDRLGARWAIALGCVLAAGGQIGIGFADSVPAAIAARVLVGGGDAFVFISVVRLVPAWFPPRTVPVLTQVTGMTGQLGQLLSLGPLVGLVHARGWTTAFVAFGSLALAVAVVVIAVVRTGAGASRVVFEDDSPDASRPEQPVATLPPAPTPAGLRGTLRNPGTREAFWVHFVCPLSANAFVMLWGFPYMTRAEGLADSTALSVLSVYVLGCLVFSPLLGLATVRFARHHAELVAGLVGLQIAVWAAILLWPGSPPVWAFVVLAVTLGAGGPASLIGFDIAQRSNPLSSLGLATGVVNTGGFVSTLLVVLGVGVVLDLLGQSSPEQFTDTGFAIAWLVQLPLWVLGLTMVFRSRAARRRVS
ncbi:MAG: MFS transporter [Cellulomonadaceae bacterium]